MAVSQNIIEEITWDVILMRIGTVMSRHTMESLQNWLRMPQLSLPKSTAKLKMNRKDFKL